MDPQNMAGVPRQKAACQPKQPAVLALYADQQMKAMLARIDATYMRLQAAGTPQRGICQTARGRNWSCLQICPPCTRWRPAVRCATTRLSLTPQVRASPCWLAVVWLCDSCVETHAQLRLRSFVWAEASIALRRTNMNCSVLL